MSKFLALLLQSAWMSALLTWFLAMLILLWLYMAELLPMLGRYSFNDGSYVPLGPWMTVFSLPSCLLGFLFKVYMPERVLLARFIVPDWFSMPTIRGRHTIRTTLEPSETFKKR